MTRKPHGEWPKPPKVSEQEAIDIAKRHISAQCDFKACHFDGGFRMGIMARLPTDDGYHHVSEMAVPNVTIIDGIVQSITRQDMLDSIDAAAIRLGSLVNKRLHYGRTQPSH